MECEEWKSVGESKRVEIILGSEILTCDDRYWEDLYGRRVGQWAVVVKALSLTVADWQTGTVAPKVGGQYWHY